MQFLFTREPVERGNRPYITAHVDPGERSWTFFTHHGHVLLSLARDPTLRLRDIAGAVGVTERATATLVSELVHAGYLQRFKDGRRNRYRVNLSGGLRHDLTGSTSVGEVFAALLPNGRPHGAGDDHGAAGEPEPTAP
jgi:hypothetical protein